MSDGGAPPLSALLIGIDCYLAPRDPRIPRYHQLYGGVRDVERMARWLRRTLGVPEERIVRLVAPHGEPPPPPERCREWPCYEGMVAAFERLIDQARPGEHAWIHFSGHGGRAPTIVPEAKGRLGLDECLVPWDVGDPGARYLRDVEVAVLLERMERAGLFATVVVDCCHSGGTTRRGTLVRGVGIVDRMPRSLESLVVSPRRRHESRSGLGPAAPPAGPDRPRPRWGSPSSWRHVQLPGGRDFDPTGHVLLAACRPGERALEEPGDDGEAGGAFTRSLLRALGDMEREATYSQLLAAAGEDVRSRYPAQTPLIEGEAERLLLGRTELPRPHGVAVLGEGRAPGTVRLATGSVHGVPPGARFAIEPPAAQTAVLGTTGPREAAGPAALPETVVEVTEAGAAVSEARVVGRGTPGGLDGLETGDRAVLLPRLVTGADHLERWRRLAGLENRSSDALLRGRLTVMLERLPAGWRPGAPASGVPFDSDGGVPQVAVGDWVALRIVNDAPEELNVAVLDLRPDRSVAQVFPAWHGGWYQPVDAGRDRRIPLRAWLPEGMASGADILLVLATTGPVCHRWLELPPGGDVGGGEPAPLTSNRPTGEAGVGRSVPVHSEAEALDDGPDGWVTARTTLKVVRRRSLSDP